MCHAFHCKLAPPSNQSLKTSFLLAIKKCKFNVEGYFFYLAWGKKPNNMANIPDTMANFPGEPMEKPVLVKNLI